MLVQRAAGCTRRAAPIASAGREGSYSTQPSRGSGERRGAAGDDRRGQGRSGGDGRRGGGWGRQDNAGRYDRPEGSREDGGRQWQGRDDGRVRPRGEPRDSSSRPQYSQYRDRQEEQWEGRDRSASDRRQGGEGSRRDRPRVGEVDDDYTEQPEEDWEDEYGGDEDTGPSRGVRGRGRPAEGGGGGNPRDALQGEALYGVYSVLAALKARRRTVHRAFLLDGMDLSRRKDAGLLRQAERLLQEREVPVERHGRHHLNLLSGDRPHQGLVLDASSLDWAPLDEFPSADEAMQAAVAAAVAAGSPARAPVWVALDEVTDPQNMGAVIRSAYCLGASGVLGCARNCAPLSATVSKASAGALEAVQLHSCRNLPRTLLDARAKGWTVLGAAAGPGSAPVEQVAVAGPTILVLGSEGSGLRTNVRRACDSLVRVEMAPQSTAAANAETSDAAGGAPASLAGLVDSLNVSVAAGILLHALLLSAAAAGAGGPKSTAAAEAAAA